MTSTIEKWMGGDKSPKKSQAAGKINTPIGAVSGNRIIFDEAGLVKQGYIFKGENKDIIEEYRVIKRRLFKSMRALDTPYQNVILVTSALQGDGKTFTAINLALSIAMEIDRTVLLIDGDVIKSGVCKTLGIPESKGLVDLVRNSSSDYSDVIYKTSIDNLTVIPSGQSGTSDTELLSSDRMHDFCDEISRRYPDRIIVIDSPPILQTTESQALAHILHNVVFVVSAAHTPANAVSDALNLLEANKNIQFILNKARLRSAGMYYYYGDK